MVVFVTYDACSPGDGSSLPVVRAGDIEAVVAAWSGVPVERLTEDEMSKLVRLVSVGQQIKLKGLGIRVQAAGVQVRRQ
jgi:hypothetical protein